MGCLEVGGVLEECRRHVLDDDDNSGSPSATDLPPLGVDPDSIIMAGFSLGSFISHQMHIVYSETIKGAGLIAGFPYYSRGLGA